MENKFLTYKGKPLVRSGNTIYYGSMCDPYVVMLQIRNTKKENNIEVPDQILIQLLRTGKDIKPQDMVAKKSERNGLASAVDMADIWLRRALTEEEQ